MNIKMCVGLWATISTVVIKLSLAVTFTQHAAMSHKQYNVSKTDVIRKSGLEWLT